MDEHGIVIRNKARLVPKGYNQEKGIKHFVLKILAVKEHSSAPQKHGGCTCRKDVTMFDQCVTNGGKNPLTCIHDALAQKASI